MQAEPKSKPHPKFLGDDAEPSIAHGDDFRTPPHEDELIGTSAHLPPRNRQAEEPADEDQTGRE